MYQKHTPSGGAKSLRKILNILRNYGKRNRESLPAASTMDFHYGATTDRNGPPSSLWLLSLQVGKTRLFLLTIFAVLYYTHFLYFIIIKGSIMNHADFQIATFVS